MHWVLSPVQRYWRNTGFPPILFSFYFWAEAQKRKREVGLKYSVSGTSTCWSCSEILKQYEHDYINKYELNGINKLDELIASQAELHKKMDTILQLLQNELK